ncbi:molybdenum cofactor guanylyltransferase MobA [Oceanisphaera avium]|uniref:Molybdenum cofactor guanylyltransferase n=1 Tax=Oceanisphaera avium TaxID=1903694 RepID=A0A1Y0CUS0_9GAMM|nr:molybdenum cofactor guanylyltransferase MobA [Oceanisphaera avium]ART79090.1 molybdenum cofactor guanylyltransferase MobA [Oceanisphaera avium]
MLTPSNITAVILAGGEGRRMQGADKGLLLLGQRPLVAHLLERLTPQVSQVLINANRNLERYQAYAPVFKDANTDFAGPLAGMEAGLRHAAHDWVLFIPCDSPLIPNDLAARMASAITDINQIAVVHDGEQLHAATALIHTSLLPSLQHYLDQGERKLRLWYAQHQLIPVDFSDTPSAFTNLNTPASLKALEASQQL